VANKLMMMEMFTGKYLSDIETVESTEVGSIWKIALPETWLTWRYRHYKLRGGTFFVVCLQVEVAFSLCVAFLEHLTLLTMM